jgi:hypothetical protein
MNSDPPRVDVTPELLDEDEQNAIELSAGKVLEKIKSCKKDEGVLNFGETVWPAVIERNNVSAELVVVPLDRLGAVQGISGNHVLVGYFADKDRRLIPSRPMVIKLSPKRGAAKLKDEYDRAQKIRLHLAYYPGNFALPIYYERVKDYGVLWSPFSSSIPLLRGYPRGGGPRLALGIDDLWHRLRGRPGPETWENPLVFAARPGREAGSMELDAAPYPAINLEEAFRTVFELLKPLHLDNGAATRIEKDLVDEYKVYLRNMERDWGRVWDGRWAPKTEEKLNIYGRTRMNPLWVLDQLRRNKPEHLYCGGVHGDLHPKNILFSEQKAPGVIDFGWAAPQGHIAKDFVLLECNLRFMVLRPELPTEHVEQIANWVAFNALPPVFNDGYCKERIGLIQVVRQVADETFPRPTNWAIEYVTPLFLVALGLLRQLQDADNQLSAELTVLSAGEYVAHNVLGVPS